MQMLETLRRRQIADAAIVAVLWAAFLMVIGHVGDFDVLLPMVSSLGIFAVVEAFRLWRGTPLRGANYWRITTLAFWTVVGFATFVVGLWYLLPISLVVLGIVLFENELACRPSTPRAVHGLTESSGIPDQRNL
jgi:hypothetical protein